MAPSVPRSGYGKGPRYAREVDFVPQAGVTLLGTKQETKTSQYPRHVEILRRFSLRGAA